MTIEDRFDVAFVAELALREKQIQQNYRPIIAVHKWFARRPGALFRSLLLSEFAAAPLRDAYFRSHDLDGLVVADPFMGGGTPLIEANRMGCDVWGCDVNPMAAWIVREELADLDCTAYRQEAARLIASLEAQTGQFYLTDCPRYGDSNVPVKYFLWVKTATCEGCQRNVDLFPGYLLADDARHPRHVVVCANCGDLNETDDPHTCGECAACGSELPTTGPARKGRCACRHCGHVNRYPQPELGPPQHRLFAIEYFNPLRKKEHRGRFFKRPDERDLRRVAAAEMAWQAIAPRFVPQDEIPRGDETDRLHRWGYQRFCDLFSTRQLLGMELGARLVDATGDPRLRQALATNFSDLLRYQNLLCRYDTSALKSLDVFSVHGFPVGLVQCESNLLGIAGLRGGNVGSGGWRNIVEKYAKAKDYCRAPFEVRISDRKKAELPIPGEWIGIRRAGARPRRVDLRCASSTDADLKPNSVDAVLTDPPYFGNVQYGELMEFCHVWLRRLVHSADIASWQESARSPHELTGNVTLERGLHDFARGLAEVFSTAASALKPGGPFAFTFHHNRLEAYAAVGLAVLNAELTCTAVLPCPAEMGGSIHIQGTGSSIVDSVFVCRHKRLPARSSLSNDQDALMAEILQDCQALADGGVRVSPGDVRCVAYGQLTRHAILALSCDWSPKAGLDENWRRLADAMKRAGDPSALIDETCRRLARRGCTAAVRLPLFPEDDVDAVPL